jgi:class 3 adenylate cyclase
VCGHVNPSGSRFCNGCGQRVAGAPVAGRAPENYTPKHLAEKILTSRNALEGERKQVTVLFADLKGSMELLTDRDPEEARALLDPVLGHMMDAVHRYEGTVNQVMGDGIMALFGAPLAHEDHRSAPPGRRDSPRPSRQLPRRAPREPDPPRRRRARGRGWPGREARHRELGHV